MTAAILRSLGALILLGYGTLHAATFNFTGSDSSVDLSNYYIYFQASSQAADTGGNVSVSFNLTNGSTGTFGFDTSGAGSVLTTNQVSLSQLQNITINNLNASRMYLSYGQFGLGISYTNSTQTNYVAPSRFQGTLGSDTPFQFFEGNATSGNGNFDSTFIDAFSFAYSMSNNSTGISHGLTNFSAQYYQKQILAYSVTTSNGTYPNVVTNGAGNTVAILGNGNITTPPQFPGLTNYLSQLASNQTTVLIGWNSNAAVAGNGRTAIQKQYGADYVGADGTLYTNGTMAVWSTFDGSIVTNNSQLSGTGFSLNTNTGMLLTNGTIQIVYWGGSNGATISPYTPTNMYVSSSNSFSNVAMLAQGTTNLDLNTLMRTAPQNTNPTNTLPNYSYNAGYSNFIAAFSSVTNGGSLMAQGNVIEQQNLYISDFYASMMLGLAGSTNIDTNTGIEIGKEYSGIWWGWTNPVSFWQVQTNSSNYDGYGALISSNSAGTSYGYAYSDRFIGDNSLLLDWSSNDTVTVMVGSPLLVPEPSVWALLGLGFAAGGIFLVTRRKKAS
jgi:hypothetical protein